MKWLYKLEAKHKNWCIQNLMLWIVIGQALVAACELLLPSVSIAGMLAFSWPYILQRQVWRVFTFLFVPQADGLLALVLGLYFFYFVGRELENAWGSFRFNAYYWLGALGAAAAGVITGLLFPQLIFTGTTYYLHLSLFLAFATLFPDMQVLLFFIIPVKVKYLGFFDAALLALALVFGGWEARIAIVFSMINYLLFFGGGILKKMRQNYSYRQTRAEWRKQNRR